jgi:hypothetical protein
MSDLQDASFAAAHYREIAGKLRAVARECHFPITRRELLDLATRYDRRADHFKNLRED